MNRMHMAPNPVEADQVAWAVNERVTLNLFWISSELLHIAGFHASVFQIEKVA